MARFCSLALDVLLNGGQRPSGRLNVAGKGDGDVPGAVDELGREGNEVAGAHAGLGRDEQAARRQFEDGDLDDVAHADANYGRGTWPAAERLEERVRADVDRVLQDVVRDVDQRIVEHDGVPVGRAGEAVAPSSIAR